MPLCSMESSEKRAPVYGREAWKAPGASDWPSLLVVETGIAALPSQPPQTEHS